MNLVADLSRSFFSMFGLFQRVVVSEGLQCLPEIFSPLAEVILQAAVIITKPELINPLPTIFLKQAISINGSLIIVLVLSVSQTENRKVDPLPLHIFHFI